MSYENQFTSSNPCKKEITRQRTISILSVSSLEEDQLKYQSEDKSRRYTNSESSDSMESARKRTMSTCSLVGAKEEGKRCIVDESQNHTYRTLNDVSRKCQIPGSHLNKVIKSVPLLERCYLFILHNNSILCQSLVLCLSSITFVLPYWELDETPHGSFFSGLWKFCLFSIKCDYFYNHGTTRWLHVVQITFTLCLIFQSVSLISAVVSKCFDRRSLLYLSSSFVKIISISIAGLLNLIGTIIYGRYQGYEDPKELYWCYWLSVISNFILFFIAFQMIKNIYKHIKSRKSLNNNSSFSNMQQSTKIERTKIKHNDKKFQRQSSLSGLLNSDSSLSFISTDLTSRSDTDIVNHTKNIQEKVKLSPKNSFTYDSTEKVKFTLHDDQEYTPKNTKEAPCDEEKQKLRQRLNSVVVEEVEMDNIHF